ncbi:hypothetical protein ACIEGK_27960 [Citrobacter freundii]|uniref:hypothetical protein n=1 Tax=Citrobacter freundii TaxID=546 RepID=UPI0037C5B539
MSKQEDTKSLFDFFPERFKNGLYGYILTSFVVFNWENIILILKSKNDIEMTLIYISLQQNFSWNFFWLPLLLGIFAAFMMPLVSTLYSLTIAGITEASKDSEGIGTLTWRNIKSSLEMKSMLKDKSIEKLKSEVTELNDKRTNLLDHIGLLLEQKENLELFLNKVLDVYEKHPELKTKQNLIDFLDSVKEQEIYNSYPGGADLRKLLNLSIEAKEIQVTDKIPDTNNKASNEKSVETTNQP